MEQGAAGEGEAKIGVIASTDAGVLSFDYKKIDRFD
jgi:hypothetical protein